MQENLQGNLLGNLMGNLTGNNNINAFVKPADWPDIRTTTKCIALLVANVGGAYPKLGLLANVANGYSVFIDGVKFGDYANGVQANIDWTTYSATAGYSITHPAAANAHIVEIEEQVADTPISNFKCQRVAASGVEQHGILWAHFNCEDDGTSLSGAFYLYGVYLSPLLEAITADNNILKTDSISNMASSFLGATYNMQYLKYLPQFDLSPATNAFALYYPGGGESELIIKNKSAAATNLSGLCAYNTLVKRVRFVGGTMSGVTTLDKAHFNNQALLNLPQSYTWAAVTSATDFITNSIALQDTYLDVSAATGLTRIGCYSDNLALAMRGFKGLIVSNAAPFSGSSPQININYTGLDRTALITLFNSMPTVSGKTISIVGATGAAELTAGDLAIATGKGWTVLR